MTLPGIIMFIVLNGLYEPSAIQQLPDGRFLVAEDERDFPFSLLTTHPDGTTMVEPLVFDSEQNNPGKLDDLEGLATDSAGFVYAITSHSRNRKGEEKKSREKLSGPVAKEQTQFRLWFWSGQANAKPRHAEVEGLAGFEHAEGVTPALIDGKPGIVIVSDDGSRAEGRSARFLLLAPDQIRILP